MEYNKMDKNETRLLIFSLTIAFSLAISFAISKDIFWTLLFSLIIGGLTFLSFKLKNKLLLRLVAIFGIIHLIIFPYCYVILLNQNLDSFTINKRIVGYEKTQAITEITEFYKPEELNQKFKFIETILSTNDPMLDSSFNFLINGNVGISQKFIFHRSSIAAERAGGPMSDLWTIIVGNENGKKLNEFSIRKYKYNYSIKVFFEMHMRDIEEKLKTYSTKKEKFDRDEVWHYSSILWYSMNIFDSKHFIPNTRIANIVFFLHRFIFYLLLTFVGTSIYNSYLKPNNK